MKPEKIFQKWQVDGLSRIVVLHVVAQRDDFVDGTVRLKLYKGSCTTVARWSDKTLYSEEHVTFEDDMGAYDQSDAQGFIQLNALRLKLLAARNRRSKG